MITKNQEQSRAQKVEVSRTQSRPAAIGELAPGLEPVLPVLRLNLPGMSPLAVRPDGKLAREKTDEARSIPHVKISLYDGTIELNGQQARIPLGLGLMTAKELKRFFGVHEGHALFVRGRTGLQRIRDSETVEVVHGASFTHEMERPAIRTVPRYRDS